MVEQYFRAVILDDDLNMIGYIDPNDYNSSGELMSHSYMGNSFVNAVWAAVLNLNVHDEIARVAWLGYYADHTYYTEHCKDWISRGRYQEALSKAFGNHLTDFWRVDAQSVEPLAFDKPEAFDGFYFVNHSDQVYIDLGKFATKNNGDHEDAGHYVCDLLPLLTACGNGEGSGDYKGPFKKEVCGAWAFKEIELADSPPPKYAEVMYNFKR